MSDVVLLWRYTDPLGYLGICRPYRLSICCVNEENTPEAEAKALAGYRIWLPRNPPGSVVLRKFAAKFCLTRAIQAIDHDFHCALGRSLFFQVLLQSKHFKLAAHEQITD